MLKNTNKVKNRIDVPQEEKSINIGNLNMVIEETKQEQMNSPSFAKTVVNKN